MRRIRLFQVLFAGVCLALAAALSGAPAGAQTWSVVEPGAGVASAKICPEGEEGSDDFLCFRLECSALEPLHFALDIAGRAPSDAPLAATVGVDGGDVGLLTFTPHEANGYTRYTAAFVPDAHEEMVDLLQRGLRASLRLDWPEGAQDVAMGLTGSADSLYTVMQACPQPLAPAPPVENPSSLVLGEIVAACGELGGTVAMEPGFERREDLDGDGREDLVIDYAAAVCSQAVALNCGSGGCTVGFFLARDGGYARMFSDVIRGYEVFPGGFLALDLHGTACGLYGFEACRKVFDIAGDAPVLVEEIAGPEAETVAIAGTAVPEAEADAEAEPGVDVAAAEAAGAETETEAGTDRRSVIVLPDDADGGAGDGAEEAAPVADPGSEPADGASEDVTVAAAVPDAMPDAAPDTGPDTGPDAAPETVPVAEPQPAPEPEPEAAPATEPEPQPAPEPGPEAVPATEPEPAMAMAATGADGAEDEGPTSRHDAGPAPIVPQDARFRGDGTLILPEDAG